MLLERAGNGISEDRLVLWQSEEMVSGADDMTSLALAADLIAMALGTLGALVAARVAAAASDRDPEGPATKAAVLSAALQERAGAPSLDPAGIARLRPLVETASELVAIELVAAKRVGDVGEEGLSDALSLVRKVASEAGEDEIGAVAELVRSGVLAAASDVPLPSVVPLPPGRSQQR